MVLVIGLDDLIDSMYIYFDEYYIKYAHFVTL